MITTKNINFSLDEVQKIAEICKILAQSQFYQKMGPGGVLGIWLTAKELGLPVMTCLNGGLYTFDGKVTMSAQLMNMLIVNAGHRADVLKLDDTICEIRFVRRDRKKGEGDTFNYSFDLKKAEKGGLLSKDNWKKNPRDMLFSRCLSGGARKFMPDVLMNCYVFGEIIDENFNDDHLVNVMPEIALPQIEEQKEIPQIDKSEDYKEFCKKHNLQLLDNGETFQRKFLLESIAKSGKTEEEIIGFAMKNEELFIEKFSNWYKNLPSQGFQ